MNWFYLVLGLVIACIVLAFCVRWAVKRLLSWPARSLSRLIDDLSDK